jgi:hypothetical protein
MYIQVKHLIRMSIENDLGMDCGLNRRRMNRSYERCQESNILGRYVHSKAAQYFVEG